MERINKIDDMGVDNAETDFTLAVKEICEEYDDKGTEKEDLMPNHFIMIHLLVLASLSL